MPKAPPQPAHGPDCGRVRQPPVKAPPPYDDTNIPPWRLDKAPAVPNQWQPTPIAAKRPPEPIIIITPGKSALASNIIGGMNVENVPIKSPHCIRSDGTPSIVPERPQSKCATFQ